MLTDKRDTEQRGFVDHVETCEFAGPLHELLHGLLKDVATARECTKRSRWGFRRNGQVSFVILTKGGRVPHYLDGRRTHVSAVTLHEGTLMGIDLQEAIDELKALRGHRINGLTRGTFGGGEIEYFYFHIDDFESA